MKIEEQAARRSQILGAAMASFAKNGFHQTTMATIAGVAGISVGSVYNYFKSKEDVIAALVAEERADTRRFFTEASEAMPIQELLASLVAQTLAWLSEPDVAVIYLAVLSEATRNPSVARLVRESDDELATHLAARLRMGQQRGEVEATLDVPHAVQTLLALLDGFAVRGALTQPNERIGTARNYSEAARALWQNWLIQTTAVT